MKKLVFLLLFLILMPVALAKQGHMKLLAVRETETGYEGGLAELYLEIKPGSGRVFLETFPLTRTDTQMSTRFAKAIACDAINRDCDDVDFFYTITADSAIIAGPSAGSSIAILTISMLKGLEIDEDAAATGTINSGGLIGPVGGLKAKIEAAKKAGLKKVLIPAGEINVRVGNSTTDLRNLSIGLGIDVVEVSTLADAVKEFTGKDIESKFKKIEISEEYTSTMKGLAKELCDRSNKLRESFKSVKSGNLSSSTAVNLTTKGKEAFERQTFYSSASYCFGANVEFSTLILLSENLSKDKMGEEIAKLKKDISDFRSDVESREKKTITDLEAYIVVKERLAEADESLDDALMALNSTNRTDRLARTIAYASERLNSAHSWSAFLGTSGKAFNLNPDVIKKSCQNKISEADERKQYVELYLPDSLSSIEKEIAQATQELEKGNYELCLSIASRAKADVDIILSVFGVESEQYKHIVDRKLEIVKNNIASQAAKGIFPILGYSYYEYANSLKETDIFSALLYSEYALELGNLNIYFKESNGKAENAPLDIDSRLLFVFFMGAAVGAAAIFLTRKNLQRRRPGHRS